LRGGEAAQIARARGRAQVELACPRRHRERPALERRLREGRRVERDDDLRARRARGGRSGERQRRQAAEKNKTPFQGGNGTGATL
jgi:hypothetical protein